MKEAKKQRFRKGIHSTYMTLTLFSCQTFGKVADVFTAVGDALAAASAAVSEGVDIVVNLLNGNGPVGDLAADVVEFLGDVATAVLDKFEDAADLAAAIVSFITYSVRT